MPGTSAGRMPATGTQFFRPPASGGSMISSSADLVIAEELRRWPSFGIVPTPAMACTLPSLVRTRIGASPPSPKCENSDHAASMVATPASTALPPWTYMRMPASVAYSDPPPPRRACRATPDAPDAAWMGPRCGGGDRCKCQQEGGMTELVMYAPIVSPAGEPRL